MDFVRHFDTPLGPMTAAGDGEALVGLWFDGQRHFARTLGEGWTEASTPALESVGRWLEVYFSGRDPGFTPLLAPRGTPFARAVWQALLEVPYGRVVTYGELAARVAPRLEPPRTSARAVGGAVGRNPISLIIPCHRVVGAGGSLTGYAGGLERKARLLALEGVAGLPARWGR